MNFMEINTKSHHLEILSAKKRKKSLEHRNKKSFFGVFYFFVARKLIDNSAQSI